MARGRPWFRLAPLGIIAAVGLCGCAWSPCGRWRTSAAQQAVAAQSPTSQETSNSSSPPIPTDAQQPAGRSSPAIVIDRPGKNEDEWGGAPAGQSPGDGPDLVPPGPAAPQKDSLLPAPAAGSNLDQRAVQKPTDVKSRLNDHVAPPDEETAGGPVGGNRDFGLPPGDPPSSANRGDAPTKPATQPSAKTKKEPPAGPLARLKQRLRSLTGSKPSPKAQKEAKQRTDETESVQGERIALPPSEARRPQLPSTAVVHGLYPADDWGNTPASPTEFRHAGGEVPTSEIAPRNAPSASIASDRAGRPPQAAVPSTGEIEQWPPSAQATVKPDSSADASDGFGEFSAIPVEEYRAVIAKSTNGASVPDFSEAATDQAKPQPTPASAPPASRSKASPTRPPAVAANRGDEWPFDEPEATKTPAARTQPPVSEQAPPERLASKSASAEPPAEPFPSEAEPAFASQAPPAQSTDAGRPHPDAAAPVQAATSSSLPPAAPTSPPADVTPIFDGPASETRDAPAIAPAAPAAPIVSPAAPIAAPAGPLIMPGYGGGRYSQPAWMTTQASIQPAAAPAPRIQPRSMERRVIQSRPFVPGAANGTSRSYGGS